MGRMERRQLHGRERLTSKKREIVRFVTDGITNKEIARRLNISEPIVKAHLTAIFRKYAISNHVHLAAIASAEIKAFPIPTVTKHTWLSSKAY